MLCTHPHQLPLPPLPTAVAAPRTTRLGLRRPLGEDLRGRRYWALGGAAGAWRVFVEEGEEGARWGWYEGEGLRPLLAWLKGAGIQRELVLHDALTAAPSPPPPPQDIATADRGVAAQEAASAWLHRARPDGYRHLTAPLLFGECDADKGSGASVGGLQQRVARCLVSLLSQLAFWAVPRDQLGGLVALFDALQVGGSAW